MYITIDIGGTNTRFGLSSDLKSFDDIQKIKTPKTLSNLRGKIEYEVNKFDDLDGLCIGVAGLINHQNSSVSLSPHIPFLNGKSLNDIIGTINTNCPVYLENDAALAGLAEAVIGEGKDFSRVAYITISTGVGGTLVIDNKLPRTKFSFEPGHHIINFNGETLAFDEIKGSWEYYSSGTGFKKQHDLNPEDVSEPEVWEEYGRKLAIGLYNVTLMWQPDIIILGGSMIKKSSLFYKSLDTELDRLLLEYKPEIKTSNLGDINGMSGGLIHIKNNLEK